MTDQRSRCSCGHRRRRGRHMPYTQCEAAYALKTAIPESNIVSHENQRPRLPALPPRMGQKVMLRPRVENLTDRCPSSVASPNDAMAVSAICAGSIACAISRAHRTHRFNHSRAGFRSRRLAPSIWRRTERQPAIKRLVNVQQNAHRCDPSGGDPGGCSARSPCRGIRLRVRKP